ncbi:MAG: right-handed parallel beta-helix repeat-containing protein [Opitutales bacterium]
MQQADFLILVDAEAVRIKERYTDLDLGLAANLPDAVERLRGRIGNHPFQVQLASGVFMLKRPLALPAGVSLRGTGNRTILRAEAGFEGEALILVQGRNGVTVADLSLRADGAEPAGMFSGLVLADCGNCNVKDVLCVGLPDAGIRLEDGCFLCEVSGCRLADCGRAGVHCRDNAGHGRGGDFVPNLITHCMAYRGGVGFEIEKTIVLNVIGCVVYQSRGYGFHIHRNSNSVVLSGCRTFQILATGNTVNYGTEAEGVRLDGLDCRADTNSARMGTPHIGADNVPPKTFHSYEVTRLEQFIKDL